MADLTPNVDLVRSLGRLARGLSALFWALPLTLIVSVQTIRSATFESLGTLAFVPACVSFLVLFHGLSEMSFFQAQERIWIASLERARLVSLACAGLSPFLVWERKLPGIPMFMAMVIVMLILGLILLYCLNIVIRRLTAMLPDETLRDEARFFSLLNCGLLGALPLVLVIFATLSRMDRLPILMIHLLSYLNDISHYIILMMLLAPLAMTMTMAWKIKEAVLESVFQSPPANPAK